MTDYGLLMKGDVLLVRGKNWISRAIQWFTRSRNEAPSRVNHAELISRPGTIEEAWAIGALVTVQERPLTKAKSKKERIEIWRHTGLDDALRPKIVAEARKYLGDYYGGLKIPLQAVDGVLGKIFGRDVYLFRRLARIDRYPICSYLVAESYDRAFGYRFNNVDPKACTPDDIDDDVLSHSCWARVAVLEAA